MGTPFQKMKFFSSKLFDLEQNKYWILSFKMIDLKILLHEQAQLGLSHSEIQVELGCQILNFAQNPRQSGMLQRPRTSFFGGGALHRTSKEWRKPQRPTALHVTTRVFKRYNDLRYTSQFAK